MLRKIGTHGARVVKILGVVQAQNVRMFLARQNYSISCKRFTGCKSGKSESQAVICDNIQKNIDVLNETHITSDSPWPRDGIYLDKPHLKRISLVKYVLEKITDNVRMFGISAPAAVGKTTLLTILKQFCMQEKPSVNGRVVTPLFLSCISEKKGAELLRTNFGFDIDRIDKISAQTGRKQTVPSVLLSDSILADDSKHFVIMLDEAHRMYNDESFWAGLVKNLHHEAWPKNVSILFCSTYSTQYANSPVDLKNIVRVDRDALVLSHEESCEFLKLTVDRIEGPVKRLLSDPTMTNMITSECRGHVGALMISVNSLYERFRKNEQATLAEAMQYYLSRPMLDQFYRCYGTTLNTIPTQLRDLLEQMLLEKQEKPRLTEEATKDFNTLVRAGIVLVSATDELSFASPIAARYVSSLVYPDRAMYKLPADLSAVDLAKIVLRRLSAAALKQLVAPGSVVLPLEPALQHLWYGALLALTTPSTYVCAELDRLFDATGEESEKLRSKPDFFIDKLRIAHELQREGANPRKHDGEFVAPDGRFVKLGARDSLTVDFHMGNVKEIKARHARAGKLLVMFEVGDYSQCSVLYGLQDELEKIKLSR